MQFSFQVQKLLYDMQSRFCQKHLSIFLCLDLCSVPKVEGCILLYFEEKQNTNYFDQSEAVKPPINLLMYRSLRSSREPFTLFSQISTTFSVSLHHYPYNLLTILRKLSHSSTFVCHFCLDL